LLHDGSGFQRAAEIGADDNTALIQASFLSQAGNNLRPALLAEAETVTAVSGVTDDYPLLVGKAVAMAHREIAIGKAVERTEVIQQYFRVTGLGAANRRGRR